MKSFLLGLFIACTSLAANAQSVAPFSWTTGARIPMVHKLPVYEYSVKASENDANEILEDNAAYYFEKVFGFTSVRHEVSNHVSVGYGTYKFTTGNGANRSQPYIVNYKLEIRCKNNKYHVRMCDFTIEHQHSPISFAYLIKSAKEEDANARIILDAFHTQNLRKINVVNNVMASRNRPASTNSIQTYVAR